MVPGFPAVWKDKKYKTDIMISKLAKQALVCTAALALFSSGLSAQSREDRKVRTPNYELAERFSAKRVGQMVFSTSVRPQWFRN